MPEHFRALIVVIALTSAAWLTLRPSVERATSSTTARQWRNLWFGLTLVAFVVGSFWIYALVALVALLTLRLTPVGALAAYCLLLVVVPAANIDLPGFGLINYFFTLNQPRLLALVVLLPAAWVLSRQSGKLRLGSTTSDKLLLGYLLLAGALQLREANFTSTLRGCFYLVTDAFLPYYVASRSLRQIKDFRYVLEAYIVSMALIGILALFETLKGWNLYTAMTQALGIDWGYGNYLGRGSLLRASVSTGQPIVLGYLAAIGLAFSFFLQSGERRSIRNGAPALLIVGGLLAALSRGPWVGAIIMAFTFVWTGRHGLRNALKLGMAGLAGLSVLTLFGVGQRIISLLPFIGSVDDFNVTYRQQLIDSGLAVISRHFWLGSADYLQTPEMQKMIQGQGIIDIVNVYLGAALDFGVIGLALFAGFFATTLWKTWREQARLPMDSEQRVLGRSLLAALVGIVVMISGVASITVIGPVYWLVAGLCIAWVEMVHSARRRMARTDH